MSAIIDLMNRSAWIAVSYRLLALLAILLVLSGGAVAYLDAHDDVCECASDCMADACHCTMLLGTPGINCGLHPCGVLHLQPVAAFSHHLGTLFRPPQA